MKRIFHILFIGFFSDSKVATGYQVTITVIGVVSFYAKNSVDYLRTVDEHH